ncbi:hypothetical protein ACYATP_07185 [Lactobacillaceae bacterium Melli_B4]
MEQFHTVLFNSPTAADAFKQDDKELSALGTPLWQHGRYIAYPYDSETTQKHDANAQVNKQMLDSQVSWFEPTTEEFDIIIKKFAHDFKITIFTTNANNNEYSGNELQPQEGNYDTCQKFVEATNEHIYQITFRGIKESHSSITVNADGVVSFKHIDPKEMRNLWNKVINAIVNHREGNDQ